MKAEGDKIKFWFGIPPTLVHAKIKKINGVLYAENKTSKPYICKLSEIKKYYTVEEDE